MPCSVEILCHDRTIGYFRCDWDACAVLAFAQDEEVTEFDRLPGRFIPEPGVEAEREWNRGIRLDGQFVSGSELVVGDIEQVEE